MATQLPGAQLLRPGDFPAPGSGRARRPAARPAGPSSRVLQSPWWDTSPQTAFPWLHRKQIPHKFQRAYFQHVPLAWHTTTSLPLSEPQPCHADAVWTSALGGGLPRPPSPRKGVNAALHSTSPYGLALLRPIPLLLHSDPLSQQGLLYVRLAPFIHTHWFSSLLTVS